MECCSSLLDIATFRIVTLWSYCNETYMGKKRWAVAAASTGGVAVDRDACYFDRGRRLGPPTPRTVPVGCSLWPRQRRESSCPKLCPAHSLQQNVRNTSHSLRENAVWEVQKCERVEVLQRCRNIHVFCYFTSCRPVNIYRRFGEARCLFSDSFTLKMKALRSFEM